LKIYRTSRSKNSQSTKEYPGKHSGLKVKVSFGFGNFSSIPWIAFLAEGQEVSHGIYPVILYYKDYDELILAYGISDTNKPQRQWDFDSSSPITIREYLHTTAGIYPKNTVNRIMYFRRKSRRVLIFQN
jgi:5-methylcytosine-specific restriction protein B